jgi:hypothetical protein
MLACHMSMIANSCKQLQGVAYTHLVVAEQAQHACLHGSRLHGAGAAVRVAAVAEVLQVPLHTPGSA